MTQTYFPFDAGAGSNVLESQWREMARLWLASGVIAGQLNELECYADSTGLLVKVPSGQAWIEGHFYQSDAEEVLTIGAADPSNPRIDRVVVQTDFVANTIQLVVLPGTPGVSPTPPALTQTADVLWEIPVAQVAVAANAITIASGDVDDERQMRTPVTQVIRRKTTDQSKTSSTALTNDADLWFWAKSGEVWEIDVVAFITGNTGLDIKFGWTTPAGTSGSWQGSGLKVGAGFAYDDKVEAQSLGTTISFGCLGGGTLTGARIAALFTAGADGPINLKFAQEVSGGSATKLKADSHMMARRVA